MYLVHQPKTDLRLIEIIHFKWLYLKDEFIDSNWHWSHHDAIQCLVIFFILCTPHIYNLPFQIYRIWIDDGIRISRY